MLLSHGQNFPIYFLSILDSVAPLNEIRIEQDFESWYNSDIHGLIKKCNYYLISFRKTKSTEDYNKYIDFRNQVSYKIKKAKFTMLKVTKIAKIGLQIRDTFSFDKLEVATHFYK